MRNLLNPKWLLVLNTLPIAILYFIFYGEFQIIKSLLKDDNISLWASFGWSLGILGVLNLGYGVYLISKNKNVPLFYGLAALICYIPFIYLYAFHSDEIIPFFIPQWMVPEDMVVYVGTFLMPTLAYSLLTIIIHLTPEAKEHKAGKNFLLAVLIPISWYIFSQIIIPFWKPMSRNFNVHVTLIFIIIVTLVFLFFLIRSVLILATKKAEKWQQYQLIWKIPLTIILPLIGLSVNNGLPFANFNANNSGFFGDFSSYWFYILAILNGVFICLPNIENQIYRLFLFVGRSITFAFTIYFFIVFLPFLPLSVIAIVAFGAGFLMLTPLLLFVLHINELSKDFHYLKLYFSKSLIRMLYTVGFLLIPIVLTASYRSDRKTLNETLAYIYSPDFSKSYDIDKISLKKVLKAIKKNKRNNRGNTFGNKQPYLSSYFNWIVLDHLTLSNTKINTIERIFFDKEASRSWKENIRNDEVEITNISTKSTYDKSQNAWKSWVDLEITNNSDNTSFSEYATTIELPVGAWVSDYYLYVEDKKEMGILAEKRSAMWVFSSIRNRNRDPGILYYLTGNNLAFRVFPFAKGEVRKTGIELLHKDPIQFDIDGNLIRLGDSKVADTKHYEDEDIMYIPAAEKQHLKKVKRKPYFHFLVDATNEANISDYINRIEHVTNEYSKLKKNAKISFVNTYSSEYSLNTDWKQKLETQSFQGGFYIDRAIKSVLYNAYKTNTNEYPIIVTLTDSLGSAIFDKDFSDWSFSFPETDLFYNLTKNNELETHSLISNPLERIKDSLALSFNYSVIQYKLNDTSFRYIPDNANASIILKHDLIEGGNVKIKEKDWKSALNMQARWRSQILHPETSNNKWLNLVKASFISKIMTPVTSYLVVENEAQKAMLKKKQKQVLASNRKLDIGNDTARMSEPSLIIVTVLLGFLLYFRNKKHKASIKIN